MDYLNTVLNSDNIKAQFNQAKRNLRPYSISKITDYYNGLKKVSNDSSAPGPAIQSATIQLAAVSSVLQDVNNISTEISSVVNPLIDTTINFIANDKVVMSKIVNKDPTIGQYISGLIDAIIKAPIDKYRGSGSSYPLMVGTICDNIYQEAIAAIKKEVISPLKDSINQYIADKKAQQNKAITELQATGYFATPKTVTSPPPSPPPSSKLTPAEQAKYIADKKAEQITNLTSLAQAGYFAPGQKTGAGTNAINSGGTGSSVVDNSNTGTNTSQPPFNITSLLPFAGIGLLFLL